MDGLASRSDTSVEQQMVSILSSYTVIPSEATPNLLPESEQINAPTHSLTIYVYKPNRLNKIIPIPNMGVLLLEAESIRALDDYGDFEPNDTIKDLIPKVDYTEPIENSPLLLVQLTRFSSSGGFCVGIAISNVIVDGISDTHFINSWATLARGGTLEEHDMPLLSKVVLSHADTTEEGNKETTLAMLKLTRQMVDKLKKKANEGNEGRAYSIYETISAHIWRCVETIPVVANGQPCQLE
ncbi:hypothetical protein JHK85_003538 [Glycine max]|nr:hypothetical protein JHK85_003538 [Glycine max]